MPANYRLKLTARRASRERPQLSRHVRHSEGKGVTKHLPILLIASLLISNACLAGETAEHSVTPKDGFVPDEQTAIRIAEAVWIPIYGKEMIEAERPIQAILHNEVWIVEGTLHAQKGGVAEAEIAKKDGRIIRVSHGK